MKSVKIEVADRGERGTRACRRLRQNGQLPVNLYGLERPVRALTVSTHDMEQLLEVGQTVVELTLGGEAQAAIMKDIQYDATGHKLIHADLVRIDRDTPVHVNVPIRFIGNAPAVSGSIVEKLMDSVALEILPLEIPREIVINLGAIAVGDRITVGSLDLPASAKPFHISADDTVVVNHIHVEKEAPEAEEGAEPEVIGAKPDEEA